LGAQRVAFPVLRALPPSEQLKLTQQFAAISMPHQDPFSFMSGMQKQKKKEKICEKLVLIF
jgi:hypothetical protein